MNRINKIFTGSLLSWYEHHGRKDLPWQNPYTDYRIWISEIMLQQTQVKTVIPYFLRFITRFPDVNTLANATVDDVLALWSGLGYYSRARHLHRTAQIIVTDYQGRFPSDIQALQSLPGIGQSTAAAIASLTYNQPHAILDGNVKRVLSRYFRISNTKDKKIDALLWQQAQACMPTKQCREYTQAIMDMGATCCTLKQPNCAACPLQPHCQAYQHQVVDAYPPKKPKKIRPIREEQFLLLYTHDRHIYLEQRPEKGIWGRLWCLPNLELSSCPATYLQKKYAIEHNKLEPLLTLKHSFTHFHLHIVAKTLQIDKNNHFPGQWVLANQLDTIGIAKPVRTIVDYFFNRTQ